MGLGERRCVWISTDGAGWGWMGLGLDDMDGVWGLVTWQLFMGAGHLFC